MRNNQNETIKIKTKVEYDLLGLEASKLSESLSRLLNLAVENVPEHMKPAILNSLFPALEALMHPAGYW